MSNQSLAEVARRGVEGASWAPLKEGWCQKFVRLCLEAVYGNRYSKYCREDAKLSGLAFRSAGLSLTPEQAKPYQPGDILYKVNAGKHGHVGIYVGDNLVAENSSTSIGRVRGALGYRTVSRYGKVDIVVRLADSNPKPEPKKPAQLILAVKTGDNVEYTRMKSGVLESGAFTVSAEELAKILLGEKGTIRDLVDAMGFAVYDSGNYLGDGSDPRQYLFVHKKTEVTA